MRHLDLFGRALRPQSQNLPTNQPVIIIIMSGFLQQHVVEGFPCHRKNSHCFWDYQGFARPRWGGYHQGGEIRTDVTIQLNQLGERDAVGKPAGNIK